MVKVRFRNFPDEKSCQQLTEIVELATGEIVNVSRNINEKVDLEITGPYNQNSDLYSTPLAKKIKRFGYVTFTNGKHLTKRDLATGIQPNKKAKRNIWYTGENARPPQGTWDGYLSFDTNLPSERSAYLPLWFLTSTNLLKSTTNTYWGAKVPTMNELMSGRKFVNRKRRFVATFIGKAYPIRMHAIEALNQAGRIDIFGTAARNQIQFPYKIAENYKFIMCFENDIYPGYVTEKPFEAYIAGAIPLYYGLDSFGYLNSKSIVNLLDYKNIDEWVSFINELNSSDRIFKEVYEQPILKKKPSLDKILNLIQNILEIWP
jgi:hypothetical protein